MITLEERSIYEIGPPRLVVGDLPVSTFGPRDAKMQPSLAPRPVVEPSLGPPRVAVVDDDRAPAMSKATPTPRESCGPHFHSFSRNTTTARA